MGRRPCCEKVGLNKGGWTAAEDKMLVAYIKANGEGKWRDLPKKAGLKRCGKSCRLRWLNYLNPKIIRGNITPEEEELIVKLHKHLGNRWSLIAGRMPGRTDNEIKNYWNTILHKKVQGDQSSFAPPRRKPRKKSHKKNISSTVNPQAIIHQPALVHPSMTVPCTEAAILIPAQPAPSQDNLSPASQSLDDSVIESESGENRGIEDMDKYYRFLLDEDINVLSWDESLSAYNDVSSELAFQSDDSMFDYWMGNTCIEQNSLLYDHYIV